MVTTIQVNEQTRDRLLRYASELQAQQERRVGFDTAIRSLLDEAEGSKEARARFERLYGSLRHEKGVWKQLEALRGDERRRLERKARSA